MTLTIGAKDANCRNFLTPLVNLFCQIHFYRTDIGTGHTQRAGGKIIIIGRELPEFAKESFNEMWKKNEVQGKEESK